MSNHHHGLDISSPDSTANISDYLPIVLNPDGTITRLYEYPCTHASPHPTSSAPVLSKDVLLNPENNTSVRIFLPRQAPDNSSSARKLPLVVYFHGGGFILCSAATTGFHEFCVEMAIQTGVMVVSVNYGLAPENRLPAAYDDAVEALRWIGTSVDEWLRDFADLSNCFLMGTSAGGNMAYQVGLRAVDRDLLPLNIKGLVLHQPFFGGFERTPSELRLIDDHVLPLFVTDIMWELSLPIGASRDHEYCNVTVSTGSYPALIRLLGWKVLVTGCDGDPLIDRQMELVRLLKKEGVGVVGLFREGGCHGAGLVDPTMKKELFVILMKMLASPPSCLLNSKI